MNPGLRMGVIGLPGVLALNVLAVQVFKKVAAVPFSSGWWSTWFPCYGFWASCLLAGAASWWWKRRKEHAT